MNQLCQNESVNLRLKGLHRDKRILLAVEEYQALDSLQIQTMFFAVKENGKPFVYGQRKAQERLLALYRAGKLRRRKVDDIYAYYLDKQPGMIKHLIDTNWVRIWMKESLPNWEKLHSWNYEQDYKILRCDALAAIKNTMTGKFRFLFIEMDRMTNAFDKVSKYNLMYEKDKYSDWWVKLTDRFPPVLFVTLTASRSRQINESIKQDNKYGLEFNVRLLGEIKKEATKCLIINGQTD